MALTQVTCRHWGAYKLYEIAAEDGLRVCVSDLGGIIQSVFLPDGTDAVLGYDTAEEYLNGETFFGAMIGPLADRLKDGCCILDGREICLLRNAGHDTMHSGPHGFHQIKWQVETLEDGIVLRHSFKEPESEFPGRLDAQIRVRVEGMKLELAYSAVCDRETAVSFTNHSYFRLDKVGCGDEQLKMNATQYAVTSCGADPACTGETAEIKGTPFEPLSKGVKIGSVLEQSDFPEIASAGGIDHYFLVPGKGMRLFAKLTSADGKRALLCRSDAPGMLVYTANGLEKEPGKQGETYLKNAAVCFETERFPNGVNLPRHRAGVLLAPGERYESVTEFEFL